MKEIYVGNLAYSVTEDDLKGHFGQYGEIENVKLIKDRYTGQSKGFAFIEFGSKAEADAALAADSGELQGRNMKVNLSRQKQGGAGGGGGGRSGGGGGNWRSGAGGGGGNRW